MVVHGYRPDVDGLRAVAVVSVLIFHVDPTFLSGGFVGVDVFFVISGYLISGIIFRELTQQRFSCLDFYSRRVRRIFPALTLVLAATWACGWLVFLSSEFRSLGKAIVAGAGFVSNLVTYRDDEWYFGTGAANPLLHLWSLGVEEQFYIVWPLLLWALWKFANARLLLLVVVSLVSFALNLATASSDAVADYYLPWNRLWELTSGAILAYLQINDGSGSRAIFRMPAWLAGQQHLHGIAGACLLVFSFVMLDGSSRITFPGWWGPIPCAGTLLLISAGAKSWINQNILAARPAVFIGLISYPLYLWHLPLLAVTRSMGWSSVAMSLGAIAAAFLLAVLTYRFVELPLRSSPRKNRVVVGLGTMMAVCGCVGYVTLAGVIQPRSASYDIERYVRPLTEDWLRSDPDRSKRFDWTLQTEGFLTLGSGSQRVLFMGDSYMQQYYQRISKILAEHPQNPRGAMFAVQAGCVPGGIEQLHRLLPGAVVTACRKFLLDALEYAKRPAIERVVVAGGWHYYFAGEDGSEQLQPGSEHGLSALQRTLAELIRSGKQVYLVLSHPHGPMFDAQGMIRRSLTAPAFELQVNEFVPRAQSVNAADTAVAARLRQIASATGARIIDPTDFFCDVNQCRAVTPDGEPMYHDAGHLRPSYVREHVNYLDAVVLDADVMRASAIGVGQGQEE